MWPKRNPTSNISRVWPDVPCIRRTHHPPPPPCSTFIYGKSPLNATQNEFNNESNIKMVICYVRVRAKGMAVCASVWRGVAHISFSHSISFADFLFVRSFQVNRSAHLAKSDSTTTTTTSLMAAASLCLRFRYYCCEEKKPTERNIPCASARGLKTNRFWNRASAVRVAFFCSFAISFWWMLIASTTPSPSQPIQFGENEKREKKRCLDSTGFVPAQRQRPQSSICCGCRM